MSAGESLVLNGQTYTFNKTGDRAKDLLSIASWNNLGAKGTNVTFVKDRPTPLNQIAASDVQKIVKNGVRQQIYLDSEMDSREAAGGLGHEAFVHADKDADALTEIDQNPAMQNAGDVMNISNSGEPDHRALGSGSVTKFKQFMSELTNKTGDSYYEQEYQRQVNDYKNRY